MELDIACWYKEKIGNCAVLRVWEMWHKPGLWSSPKVMLSRYLLAHRKGSHTEDARVFHFMIFLILQKLDFFVFLGSCNKMPQAGWLINSRHLLLTVLETRNFKVKVPARSSTWKRALTSSRLQASFYGLIWQKGWELSGDSFKRALIPFIKALPWI